MIVDGGRPARFISDVHLLPERAPGAEPRTRWFLDFLSECARAASRGERGTLYVLGDLFDFWHEAGGRPPRGFEEVLRAMREAVSSGLGIVTLPGNRDFLVGAALARETGVRIAPDEIEITLGGERIHLTHGDGLTRGDHRYRLWRRLSRGGAFRRIANGMPSRLADPVARALRQGSELEKGVKGRSSGGLASMSYSEAALRTLVARGADVIVAGHVHSAGERVIEAGGRPSPRLRTAKPSPTPPKQPWLRRPGVASAKEGGRTGRLLVLGSWDEGPGAYAEWTGDELRLVR